MFDCKLIVTNELVLNFKIIISKKIHFYLFKFYLLIIVLEIIIFYTIVRKLKENNNFSWHILLLYKDIIFNNDFINKEIFICM
jgi:hypothetical protein